jgi:hypothetical protein
MNVCEAWVLIEVVTRIMDIAKDEFNAIRARSDLKVAEKKQREEISKEKLENSINSCLMDYKRKQFYAENGAKFTNHFISSFGKIIKIEIISESICLVFCEQGAIEVWSMDLSDSGAVPEMIEFISVNRGEIACVEQFNSVNTEIDDDKQKSVAPGSATTSSRNTRPTTAIIEEEDEEEELEESDKEELLQSSSRKDTTDNFTKQFFIGLEDGRACKIAIQFVENPGSTFPRIVSKVQETKKISSAPIKTTVLDKLQGLVLTTVWNPDDDQQLIAINDQLQIVWRHKISDIAYGCADTGLQSFNFIGNEQDKPSTTTSRAPSGKSGSSGGGLHSEDESSCTVSLLKYDEINARILVALSWGSILSLGYKEFGPSVRTSQTSQNAMVASYQASHLYNVLELEENEELGAGSLLESSRPSMSSFGRQSSSNIGREIRPPTVKVISLHF